MHDVLALALVLAGAIMLLVGYLRYRDAERTIADDRALSRAGTSIAIATAVMTGACFVGMIYIALR